MDHRYRLVCLCNLKHFQCQKSKLQLDEQPSHPLQEQVWLEEREQLVAQISERDQLLMVADAHMEAEISKLQKELGINQQVW